MANVDIVVRVRDTATRTLRQIGNNFRAFGAGIEAVSRQLVNVGVQMTALGASMLTVSAIPIKFAADFEQAMSAVRAQGEITEENFQKLEEQVVSLSETTKFTALEAAQALLDLTKAGLDVEERLEALPVVLDVAAAATIDLSEATQIVVQTMRQFGLEATDLREVGDVLVRTAQLSTTNMVELAEAFKFVGPIARSAGVSLQQTAATLAVFANAGIRGGQAGRALRSILLAMTTGAGAAGKVFQDLNISVQDSEGNFLGLDAVLGQLADRLENLGQIERLKILENIFGKRFVSQADIAIRAIRQANGGLADLQEKIENAAGAADRAAKVQLDNFSGSLILLQSATASLLTTLGAPFLKTLTRIVKSIIEIVLQAKQWAEENSELATTVLAVIGVLGTIITLIGSITLSLGLLGLAISGVIKGFAAWTLVLTKTNFALLGMKANILSLLAILPALIALIAFREPILKAIASFKLLGVTVQDIFTVAVAQVRRFFVALKLEIDLLILRVAELQARFSAGGKALLALNRAQVNLQRENLRQADQVVEELKREAAERKIAFEDEERRRKATEASQKKTIDNAKKLRDITKVTAEEDRRTLDIIKQRGEIEVDLARLQTTLAQVEVLAKQGEASVALVFDRRREIIVKQFERELLALQEKLSQDSTLRTEIERKIQILDESRKQQLIRLEQEQADAEKRIVDQKLQLDKLVFDARVASSEELNATEIQKLDERHTKEIEQLAIRHNQRLQQAQQLVKEAEASKSTISDILQLQVEEEERIRERQRQERERVEADIAARTQSSLAGLRARAIGDLQSQFQLEIIELENRHRAELESFKKLTEDKAAIAEFGRLQDLEGERLLAAQKQRVLDGIFSQTLTLTSGMTQLFDELYTLSGEKAKEFFFLSKSIAIAEATINTAQAVSKALAQGGIFGVATAAVVAALGTVQIGKIVAQSFAQGGMVKGGIPGKDSVLIAAQEPEYVVRGAAVKHYGAGVMEAINRRLIPKNLFAGFSLPGIKRAPKFAFQEGGPVVAASGLQRQATQQTPINIVNVPSPQLVEEYLASTPGQRTLINVLANSKEDVKQVLFET